MDMQSNFEIGELSNQQHLMDSNIGSPVLPIFFNPQKQNNFQQQLQQQHHLSQLVHPIPITHELFQQFQEQQSGMEHWQMGPLNFKLGLNENSGTGEVALDGGDHLLHENNPIFLQPRPQNLGFKSWQSQEFGARKEPFW